MTKKRKKNGNMLTVLSREGYLRQLAASKEPLNIKLTKEGDPYMKAALDEMDKINQSEKERYLYLREAMAQELPKKEFIVTPKSKKSLWESNNSNFRCSMIPTRIFLF